jgi:hypothetical protein
MVACIVLDMGFPCIAVLFSYIQYTTTCKNCQYLDILSKIQPKSFYIKALKPCYYPGNKEENSPATLKICPVDWVQLTWVFTKCLVGEVLTLLRCEYTQLKGCITEQS